MDRKVSVELIEWTDPYSIDEWTPLKDFCSKINKVITIGQLLDETPTEIVVALNYSPIDDHASCIMVINKTTIVRRRKIDVDKVQKKRR